jgi:hypothetical protein
MAELNFQKLPDALKEMAKPFDWDGFVESLDTDNPRTLMPSPIYS